MAGCIRLPTMTTTTLLPALSPACLQREAQQRQEGWHLRGPHLPPAAAVRWRVRGRQDPTAGCVAERSSGGGGGLVVLTDSSSKSCNLPAKPITSLPRVRFRPSSLSLSPSAAPPAGFPFRWTHETFYKRYRCCSESPAFRDLIPKAGIDWKAGCNALAADISGWIGKAQGAGAGPSLYESIKFGKTMVLYRADQHRTLEMVRDYRRESAASNIQRVFRGHRARKHYRVLREALKRVRAAIKARDLALVTAAFTEAKALGIPPTLHEMMSISALHTRLVAERDCRLVLTSLLAFDPVDKYAEYEAALKEVSGGQHHDDERAMPLPPYPASHPSAPLICALCPARDACRRSGWPWSARS